MLSWPGASEALWHFLWVSRSIGEFHALLCCCLVLFSACCCCFGCFCCWSCCPLLEILVPCNYMFQQMGRAKRASEARERSSLMLPLGFHGPLCMHCSAAVWCFSLLTASASGASAAAGLVASCWKFWSLAVAWANNFQQCSRFPFLAKTNFFRCLFRRRFVIVFFFGFGRALKANMRPKINFWRTFWDAFLAPSCWSLFFWMYLNVFFQGSTS